MKNVLDKERIFLRKILGCSCGLEIGKSFLCDLFCSDGIALFFLDDGRCCILSKPDENLKVSTSRLRLFNLLVLLNDLEQNNMIYCLDSEKRSALYMMSQDTSVAKTEEKYLIEGYIIEEYKEAFTMKTSMGNVVMSGNALPQTVADILRHYIDGRVFPTSRLYEFVNRDFKSIETLRYEKEIGIARKSLYVSWAAFAVAILSIIFSVPISNQWGESTIKPSQYEDLKTTINKVCYEIQKAKGGYESNNNRKDILKKK